ncbi:MAG TPA: radical SAM family heme chaperone HemW, partial [Ktedonobacterales bacterium]|nr:radical SAM family heme chaperone HemW [Ktedonobacterales bacterium]
AAEIALAGERARLPDGRPRRCRTIFFGGGTPSLLTADQVAWLLGAARQAFAVDAAAEITLEANPGAIERGHLGELHAVGITRLSMGAQSFDAGLLRWMGRIHTPAEIEDALHAARHAGFTSINLDFIFALPGQTLDTWSATLERALALAPEHLSLYSLIVEEGTPLHRWVAQGRVRPADDDVAADHYEYAAQRLAAAGYQQYEISNWALPGHQCQHNLTYWRNLPYVGLGAGAHGWFGARRYAEARPIHEYIGRVVNTTHGQRDATAGARTDDDARDENLPGGAIVDVEVISPEMEMAETAMLGLRLVEGLSLNDFARRYGRTFASMFGARLADVTELGLVEVRDDWIRLTERGRLLGNEVFERVLP